MLHIELWWFFTLQLVYISLSLLWHFSKTLIFIYLTELSYKDVKLFTMLMDETRKTRPTQQIDSITLTHEVFTIKLDSRRNSLRNLWQRFWKTSYCYTTFWQLLTRCRMLPLLTAYLSQKKTIIYESEITNYICLIVNIIISSSIIHKDIIFIILTFNFKLKMKIFS